MDKEKAGFRWAPARDKKAYQHPLSGVARSSHQATPLLLPRTLKEAVVLPFIRPQKWVAQGVCTWVCLPSPLQHTVV